MKIDRKELLRVLSTTAVGTTKREILEQSNCMIFDSDSVVAFNDSIFTKVVTPLPDVEGAVPAEDLMAVLAKFPDESIDVFTEKGELRIKGKNRSAGITMSAQVQLPYSDVPGPAKWKDLPPEMMGTLIQAARVCGNDESLAYTVVVHLAENWVEACDRFRLFRSSMPTGMSGDLLIPAASIEAIGGLTFHRFSVHGGWLHLETKGKHQVSVRCTVGTYPDLSSILELKHPKKVVLPANLPDILARAEIMQDFNAMVHITIAEGKLTLHARKDAGWYKESKSVEYADSPLNFEVNLKFMQEILAKTRKVTIDKSRMQIKSGETVFCVSLEAPKAKKDQEQV